MRKHNYYTFCFLISFLFLPFLFQSQSSFAQEKKDNSKILTVFIYNFAKYVEWPEENSFKTFKIGALTTNKKLLDELNLMVQKKQRNNIPIEIVELTNLDNIDGLQMIFSDLKNGVSAKNILDKIADKPILLITDNNPDFNNSMINFLQIDDKQKFSLNKPVTDKHHLKVSSALEQLASSGGSKMITTEKEWKDIYSKYRNLLFNAPDKILVSKEDLTQIVNEHDDQTAKIAEQMAIVDAQNQQIKTQQNKLTEQLKSIQEQELKLSTQELKIKTQEGRFQTIEAETKNQVAELNKNKEKLNELAAISSAKDKEIAEKEKLRLNNQQEIENQTKQIKEQQFVLNTQKSILYVSVGVILLISVLAFISYRNFRQKKKANIELAEKKLLIEEKQKEIIDSITYARRIQRSLLPSEKYIDKTINRMKGEK